jgi:molybdenum cofactor synthesis domain-containing protein
MISLLIIGDEILSAQVVDENLQYMLKSFAQSGHTVSEVRFVRDSIESIAFAVKELSNNSQFLISSGGVGPTHDDITLEAYAYAFNEELYYHPFLEDSLRKHYQDKINSDALRMALVPSSTELIDQNGPNWPVLKIHNCFVLPGVPQIFKQKFDRLIHYLPKVNKINKTSIFVMCDEIYFAKILRKCLLKYPNILIGSYPIFGNKEYCTQITLKHTNSETVNEATNYLIAYFKVQNVFVKVET